MSPSDAAKSLISHGYSSRRIAAAIGTTHTTIQRISRGSEPFHELGQKIIAMAQAVELMGKKS